MLQCWRTGRKTKQTSGGWISGNAPCCVHNGQGPDTKGRGGLLITGDGFRWHCFNCQFAAGWQPGKLLSANTKSLYSWIGMSLTDINKLGLIALKLKDDQPITRAALNFELTEVELPKDTMSIAEWIDAGCTDPDLIEVIDYITSSTGSNRGMSLDLYNWHWSAESGYRDRVIIPFYHDKKIVGYTGRKVRPGKPKYLTQAQSGYVFNLDAQVHARGYVIVVEGQFDAIAVDGVAIMCNNPNEAQVARINALGREVIVVPDRDRAGAVMLQAVLKNEWSASLPPWGDDVKDVADAVKKYGRLYTLYSILHYRESGNLKIQLMRKKLLNND